jgi:site-specific DNA recombinase
MRAVERLPVAIYSRISDDQEGLALGVARQEQDCRATAEARGWTVAAGEPYRDNSVSAYKRRVRRPEFERLLSDLRSGVVGGVVVYDLDRLARQPRDLERVLDVYEAVPGLRFATVTGGDSDLSSPDGLFMVRMMVNFANKSSADTARRVKRKHLELAEAGTPVGGSRPFGWNASPEALQRLTMAEAGGDAAEIAAAKSVVLHEQRRRLDPTEAKAIRDAVECLAAGESIASVVRSWNSAGLTTPGGKPWLSQTVKQVIRNPRIAGLRGRRLPGTNVPEIVRKADGSEVMGEWEPVVSRAEWEAACARLDERRKPGGSERKYLLSGIARCGKCGAPMRAVVAPRDKSGARAGGEGNFYYQCPPKQQGGCGGVSRSGPLTDEFVTAALLARLAEATAGAEPVEEAWEGQERLDGVLSLLADVTKAWRTKVVSAAFAMPQIGALEDERDALLAERRGFLAQQRQARPSSVNPAGEWEAASLERRRAITKAALQAVVIHPVPPIFDERKGRAVVPRAWNPDLLEMVWAE